METEQESRLRVEELLKELFELDRLPLEDDRWVFQVGGAFVGVGGATVFVRVKRPRDAPEGAVAASFVKVWSGVLTNVVKSAELLRALNDLNASLALGRIYWSGNAVVAETELLAPGVESLELGLAITQIGQVSSEYGPRLKQAFGGVVPTS